MEAFSKGAAQDGNNLMVRTQRVLQEHALKFDGMLNGETVVFPTDGFASMVLQPVYQF